MDTIHIIMHHLTRYYVGYAYIITIQFLYIQLVYIIIVNNKLIAYSIIYYIILIHTYESCRIKQLIDTIYIKVVIYICMSRALHYTCTIVGQLSNFIYQYIYMYIYIFIICCHSILASCMNLLLLPIIYVILYV